MQNKAPECGWLTLSVLHSGTSVEDALHVVASTSVMPDMLVQSHNQYVM